MKFSIVCCTNKPDVLEKNLLTSKDIIDHQLILKSGYTNICKAYNEAMQIATEDYVIFVHQDVHLFDNFFPELINQIGQLTFDMWGVLGVAGRTEDGECKGHLIDRNDIWGSPIGLPSEVQTLDELLLVVRRGSFTFDENLTSQHFFGADLCLQSIDIGLKNFAIGAFVEHNCFDLKRVHPDLLPIEFQIAKKYIRDKWNKNLPIYTTCVNIRV